MFQLVFWRLSISLSAHSQAIRMFWLSRHTMISHFCPVAHDVQQAAPADGPPRPAAELRR